MSRSTSLRETTDWDMATRRKKRCKAYGCPNLHTNANGYCDSCYAEFKRKHPWYYDADGNKISKKDADRKYDQRRGSAQQRGYDWKWRQFAQRYLLSHPVCAMCGAPAAVCDHKTATADMMIDAYGSFDYDENNYQALCASCNARKGATNDKKMREEYFMAKQILSSGQTDDNQG